MLVWTDPFPILLVLVLIVEIEFTRPRTRATTRTNGKFSVSREGKSVAAGARDF
jgi:hypothetical protein